MASLVLLFLFGFAAPVLAQPSPASSARAERGGQTGTRSMWTSVDIPGPIDALRQAAGILIPIERTRLALEIARRSYSEPNDPEVYRARTRVQALLLQPATFATPTPVRIPLPLPAEVWLETVFGRGVPAADLGRAILVNSRAALLYHGLFALDDETLAYLADTRNGTLLVCLSNARVFAKFGRGLRIRDGRVDVPGGPPAVALWEELVGAPVTDPRGFASRLLSSDRGWLAYFYDVLAHLDPPHLAFALGLSFPAADARPARFKALYAATARTDPVWVPADRPFAPPTHDLGLLLNEIRLTADNRFALPSSRRFCEAAFTDKPLTTQDEGTSGHPVPQDEVDAAFLAEQVVAQSPRSGVRQERFETILFGQRLLADGFQSDPLDATANGRVRRFEEVEAVLKAMQGMSRFRALVLTLERAGVRSPLTVAAAVRAAEAISAITGTDHRALATVQFQAAVALVDRLVSRHALPPSTASNAIRSLADATLVALKNYGSAVAYDGAIGAWFTSSLLPSLPRSVRPGLDPDSPEDVLLNALAGPPGPAGGALDSVRVPWEGATYRVDLGAAELSRLRRAYRALGGGGLDLGLDLSRLATGAISDRGALQRTAEHALAGVDRWQPAGAAGGAPRKAQDMRRAVSQVRDRLAGRGNEPLADVRDRVGPYADAVMADTLAALVYALSLGEADTALVSRELVARHDLNYNAISLSASLGAWSVPAEERGGGKGWSFVGSLLAFDVPLAPLALRRMSLEALPRPPTINKYDAQALMHTITLLDPYAMTDRDQQAIADAIVRGLRRVSELTRAGDDAKTFALAKAAGLSEWRANGLRWALAEEPVAVPGWFSLTELMWLGEPALPPEALDAWGVSIYDLTGMLACRFPRPAPWEDLGGRLFGGLVATRIPDLSLRLAQWLNGLHLPAALLPALMTRAMQDLLDQAQPSDPYDWTAIVRAAANMTRVRFEDYVSTLTTEGPLMPLPPGSR